MKYRVVYFGSSNYSLPALEVLAADSRYEIVAVVSQPDKPVGRKQTVTPTPVSAWAKEHSVELLIPLSWKKDLSAVERLQELKPDVGVLAVYGKILPQNVIDVFPKGIVNIHPSLLPKYRGPTPGQYIILNGDTESAVTIMLLSAEMDAGEIIAQEKFIVPANEIPESYYTKAFKLGAEKLMNVLPDYLEEKITLHHQDHYQATYTPLLSRDNGKIDWSQTPEQIERMVRAFTPWPGTWTEVWEEKDGTLFFPDDMREKIGLAPHGRENWDGVTKKRMKILSAYIQNGSLVLDTVQIEGENTLDFPSVLRRSN